MGKFEIVKLFIEKGGACITGRVDEITNNYLDYVSRRINEVSLENRKNLIPSLKQIQSYLEIRTHLFNAIKIYDWSSFSSLLVKNDLYSEELKIDFNIPIHESFTPLALAVNKKNVNLEFIEKMCNELKKSSCNINAMSEKKRTPLTYTTSMEVQALLINKGASAALAMKYFEDQKKIDSPSYHQLRLLISSKESDIDLSNCIILMEKISRQSSSISSDQRNSLDSILELIKTSWHTWNEDKKEEKMGQLFGEIEDLTNQLIKIENTEERSIRKGLFQQNPYHKISPKILKAIQPLKQYKSDHDKSKRKFL